MTEFPPPGPPPGDSPAPYYPPPGPPGDDVLASPAPRRGRTGLVVGVAAAVLAAAVGAGVYAATSLSGGGTQPDELAPATTFAFAKIDLDPAASQKLAVRSIADKFPSAPKGSAEDLFETFVTEAIDEADVDYDRDIKPWLGKRVGIAGFTKADGKPTAVGIVAVTDEDKAKAFLTKSVAGGDGPKVFAISRGYAVVGDEQVAVDAAVAAGGGDSLGDNKTYRDDIDALAGEQVVTAWADASAAVKAISQGVPEAGFIGGIIGSQVKGRLAIGLHAASDYIELEGLSFGGAGGTGKPAAASLLTGLPAGTVAALSVADLGKGVGQALPILGTLFGGLGGDNPVAAFEKQSGFSIANDLLPLFGPQTVLALGSVPKGLDFKAALMSVVADQAKATASTAKLAAFLPQAGLPVTVDLQGDTFVLAYGPGYGAEVRGTHGLSGAPLFTKAMGELGSSVAFAAYADLSQLLTLAVDADEYKDLKALKAFGMWAGKQDGRDYFRARLVVG